MTSRRVALSAPVLALASACGGASAPRSGASRAAADDAARDRALAAEQDLLTRYDAALREPAVTADAALKARLAAIRAEHAEHLAAVGEGYARAFAKVAPSGSATSPAEETPKRSGSSSPGLPGPRSATPTVDGAASSATAGASADAVVGALVKAEQDASHRLTADILAQDGDTAQLFASIAACEAGHAALLLGGTA